MKSRNEIYTAIKNATASIEAFFSVPEQVAFETAKIKDGEQLVSYASLEVGATVEVSTSEGSEAAADGNYELDNGAAFTVKDGVIEEVTSTPAEIEEDLESDEVPAEEVVSVEEVSSNEDVEALNARISKLETTIESILSQVESAKEDVATKEDFSVLTNEIKNLNKAVNVLANTPQEFSKIDKSNEAKDAKDRQLFELAKIVSGK